MQVLRPIVDLLAGRTSSGEEGMSLVGIVLALAAVGLIVIAAVIAFVIPN